MEKSLREQCSAVILFCFLLFKVGCDSLGGIADFINNLFAFKRNLFNGFTVVGYIRQMMDQVVSFFPPCIGPIQRFAGDLLTKFLARERGAGL